MIEKGKVRKAMGKSGIFSSDIWSIIGTVLLGLIACVVLWYLVKTYIAGMVYTVNRIFGSPRGEAKKDRDTADDKTVAAAPAKDPWDDSEED